MGAHQSTLVVVGRQCALQSQIPSPPNPHPHGHTNVESNVIKSVAPGRCTGVLIIRVHKHRVGHPTVLTLNIERVSPYQGHLLVLTTKHSRKYSAEVLIIFYKLHRSQRRRQINMGEVDWSRRPTDTRKSVFEYKFCNRIHTVSRFAAALQHQHRLVCLVCHRTGRLFVNRQNCQVERGIPCIRNISTGAGPADQCVGVA